MKSSLGSGAPSPKRTLGPIQALHHPAHVHHNEDEWFYVTEGELSFWVGGRLIDYLHVDFDAFAPEVGPGVADEPVPGGLSLEDAERLIRATAAQFRIRAATLVTYTPERDHRDKTLNVALRIIQLLGDYARTIETGDKSI